MVRGSGVLLTVVLVVAGVSWGGSPVVDRHLEDLDSTVPAVRVNAARALGRLADRAAVPALAGAVDDPSAAVRRAAAQALASIPDDRAVPSLLEALSDADTNVRFYAAYALGEIKSDAAVPALLRALSDPAYSVRDQAAWALREIRDPSVVPRLVAALRDPDADLPHTLWLLEHLGDERVAGALAELLDDTDPEIRLRAVGLLCDIGGEAVLQPLLRGLSDDSPEVRLLSIEGLAAVGDDQALPAFKRLAAQDPDEAVRAAAATGVQKLEWHDALIAYWSFDDRATEVARCVAGSGADGQIKGCTPVDGRFGAALAFGPDRYVELGKPDLPVGQTPLTVSAWVRTEATDGVVVARGGAYCGFSLYIMDGVPKFGIHIQQDGPAYVAAGTSPVGSEWAHLAGVIREDRIEIHLNGALVGTTETPGYIAGGCGQGMEIGFDVGNSPAEICDALVGVIDEVKVYHAALSPEEIRHEYLLGQ